MEGWVGVGRGGGVGKVEWVGVEWVGVEWWVGWVMLSHKDCKDVGSVLMYSMFYVMIWRHWQLGSELSNYVMQLCKVAFWYSMFCG